jgi:hypothetical protein
MQINEAKFEGATAIDAGGKCGQTSANGFSIFIQVKLKRSQSVEARQMSERGGFRIWFLTDEQMSMCSAAR